MFFDFMKEIDSVINTIRKMFEIKSFSPHIISQIAISLEKDNLENALTKVKGNSQIVKDIKKLLWGTWCGKNLEKGFSDLGKKWGFQQAIFLMLENKNLDKAIESVLTDVNDKMVNYVNSLHMPTLVLFSLGIILPLMIVSILPIISFFGIGFGLLGVICFLFLSLLGSYIYSLFILIRRPISFSMQKIKEGRLTIRSTTLDVFWLSIVIWFLIATPGIFYLLKLNGVVLMGGVNFIAEFFNTFSIIWATGVSLTLLFYSNRKAERDRLKILEDEFLNSLHHLKISLVDFPIETALEKVVRTMKNTEISKFYMKTINKIKITSKLEPIKSESEMINSYLDIIFSSVKDGTASKTINIIEKYLISIKKVNNNLNQMLDRQLSMMKATALLFGPIVCGIIVVLFQMIETSLIDIQGLFIQSSINIGLLQLIVGLYLLGLNFVLINYITKIKYGDDKVELRYNLARSFPIVLIIFTGTVIIGQHILLRLVI